MHYAPPGQYGPPGQYAPPGPFGPPPTPRKTSKRWIWITLSSVLALVLVCVGGAFALRNHNLQRSAERAAAYDEKRNPVKRESVDRLLAEHTRALKDRDLKAFLAPFDPADKKLIADQTRVFHNLTRIPFSEATFANRTMRDVTPLGAGFTFDLMVGFLHRIGEYDRAPVERRYFWKVVQDERNGPLKVTAIDRIPAGFKASDDDFYPTPWDKWATVHVEKTEHTVLIVDGSLRAEARRHAPAVEAAAVRNITTWKASGVEGEIPSGFVVSLVKGRKDLGSLWRVADEPPTEAGVSISMPTAEYDANMEQLDGPLIGGSRVVIDLKTSFFTAAAPDGPPLIFRHELAHSMVAALTAVDKDSPERAERSLWTVEGFAEYMAYSPKPWTASYNIPEGRRQLRADRGEVSLPGNGVWNSSSAGRLNYHYLLGHTAMDYIAGKYGAQKLFQFVAGNYRGKSVENLTQELFGVSYQEFERQWAAHVTGKLR
ncbi:hypothetical protein AB0K27_16780 [Micromonospora echinospora]|uniref:hypothetical protein n=1 Tax=Micromonospora echinospora TaxID=1877 RepID=UPI003448A8B5